MNLNELKLSILNQYAQLVVFDRSGTIVDSCNSLVDLSAAIGRSAYDLFPFIDSIQHDLHVLDTGSENLTYWGVESSIYGLDGFFDFEVAIHESADDCYLWLIQERSEFYRTYQEVQGERNLLRMQQEYHKLGVNYEDEFDRDFKRRQEIQFGKDLIIDVDVEQGEEDWW